MSEVEHLEQRIERLSPQDLGEIPSVVSQLRWPGLGPANRGRCRLREAGSSYRRGGCRLQGWEGSRIVRYFASPRF